MPTRKTSLKVVNPGDTPPARKPVSAKITESLDGSTRDLLASMRLALAKKLDANEISSNSIASAYKELREIDGQIRVLDAEAMEVEAGGRLKDAEFDATAI